MTAKEMFEELDFPISGNNRYFMAYTKQEIITRKDSETEHVFEVIFDKLNKKVHFYHYENDCEVDFICTPELDKAVLQQRKELGWQL